MEERRILAQERERTRRWLGWQFFAATIVFLLIGIPLYVVFYQSWGIVRLAFLILFLCAVAYLIGLMALHLRAKYLSIKVYKPAARPRLSLPPSQPEKYPEYRAYEESYHDDYTDDWEV
ncbi:MAG: hypothetical protein KGL39_54870 [Patescibacteria group bacterium]|nr:hypothetical protein [Patescibacteria group bacterium]